MKDGSSPCSSATASRRRRKASAVLSICGVERVPIRRRRTGQADSGKCIALSAASRKAWRRRDEKCRNSGASPAANAWGGLEQQLILQNVKAGRSAACASFRAIAKLAQNRGRPSAIFPNRKCARLIFIPHRCRMSARERADRIAETTLPPRSLKSASNFLRAAKGSAYRSSHIPPCAGATGVAPSWLLRTLVKTARRILDHCGRLNSRMPSKRAAITCRRSWSQQN